MPSCQNRCTTTLAVAGLAIGGFTLAAPAGLPTYDSHQIQLRSNFAVNGGGFNLPDNVFFNSATPSLNDLGNLSISVGPISGGEGVWYGGGGTGQVEYIGPVDVFISDVSLNNNGYVVFEQNFGSPDGLFFYDAQTDTSGILTDRPIGASGWGSPTVNDSGNVGYKASFLGDYALYIFDGVSAELVVADVDVDFMSPYSFIFTPSFNNNDQFAVKVRLGGPGQVGGSQPDQIRIFESDGSSSLIVEDDDGDPSSPFSGFDNSVSLTNTGWVAFNASLVSGGRGVFISDGTTTIEIATEADADVSEIEFFGPVANDSGLVAFRAANGAGLQTIYVGDGTGLTPVATEHDILPSDLGPARIDQHDGSVVFGGAPSINASGQVAFNCALTPPDDNQIEWGSGIYIATPSTPCPEDLTGDDTVNADDLFALLGDWGACAGCDSDLTGDDVVNADDLFQLLGAWGDC